jgi:hypothetical protein
MKGKKETAIDWLKEKMSESRYYYLLIEDIANRSTIIEADIFELAKNMEKQQHGETFHAGIQWIQYQRDSINGGLEYWDKEPSSFEQYYNETYK